MALTTLHTFLSSVARLFHSFANDFVNSWCPMLGSFWSSCITFRCCWQYIKNALAGFLGALGSLSLSLSFGASRFLVFFFAGGESGLMNSHGKKDGGAVLGNASETISDRSSAFQRRNKKKVSCQVNFLMIFWRAENDFHWSQQHWLRGKELSLSCRFPEPHLKRWLSISIVIIVII